MSTNPNFSEAETKLFTEFKTLFEERNIDEGEEIIECIRTNKKARVKMVGVLGDMDIEVISAKIPLGNLFSSLQSACAERGMSLAQTTRVITLLCTSKPAQIRAINILQNIVAPDEASAYSDVFESGQPLRG